MKSYLSLIPIAARQKKGESMMTRLSIICAVFLVTSIFTMADLGVKMEKARLLEKHGSENLDQFLSSASLRSIYLIALVFFLLVLVAGVLMISSSINTSVAQRTEFFGLMRCLGMTKKQVRTYVRLEALQLCSFSLGPGLILGTVSSWILALLLRYFVGGEFEAIPLFHLSPLGLVSGVLVGLLSVLISASSPGKKASRLEPIIAASSKAGLEGKPRKAHLGFLGLEASLGLNNALARKKNLGLIGASFGLSIVLFLSFTVFIDFIGHIMPQKSNRPDFTIEARQGLNSIDPGLLQKIQDLEGVSLVYGRQNQNDLPASFENPELGSQKLDLISYSDFDLASLVKDRDLTRDSRLDRVYKNQGYLVASPDEKGLLRPGDKVTILSRDFEIAGILKSNIFSSDGRPEGNLSLIGSRESFYELLGLEGYSLLLLKVDSDFREEGLEKLQALVGQDYSLKDLRDQDTSQVYRAFSLSIYGFLLVIGLVALLNIVNNIDLNVRARINEYGFMRAVGMTQKQVDKMVLVEALSYGLLGSVLGLGLGLALSRKLYSVLITDHFPMSSWQLPLGQIGLVILFVLGSIGLAVTRPLRAMRKLSINEIIRKL